MLNKECYQSVWLSDIHLGCRDCKAEMLLKLLQQTQAKRIFLVGDIVDVWALKRRVYWPRSHNILLQYLMSMKQRGCELIYIPGNHDQVFRSYAGLLLGDIPVYEYYTYTSLAGLKVLMLHGDQFDDQVCFGVLEAKIGDHLYDLLLFLNRSLARLRRHLGYPYWSLAAYIKLRIAKAQQAIARYRNEVVAEAKRQNMDMVVCGHIHQPELSWQQGLIYANDGDWIENCTLLCETIEGQIELRRWDDQQQQTVLMSQLNIAPDVVNSKAA